ncbi:MAG: hypothetical protein GIKADHBN_01522 [Phycisphaerales bacterium]|nr:hypothetical protein [Phycisphaerales bacterium]
MPQQLRIRLSAFAFLAGLLGVVGAITWAGPLDPPAGPVAGTGKTLTEVEPRIAISLTSTPGDADSLFRISQPGSYYLTGNMTGVTAKSGIEIAVSGVTIDLMGFELAGVAGSFEGIRTSGVGLQGITIRNGSVRNWGSTGINMSTFEVKSGLIEGVGASGNGESGIVAANSVITRCTAGGNTGDGIGSFTSAVISFCTANGNGRRGIAATQNCEISHCTANGNTSGGILAGIGSTVTDCMANSNDSLGISVSFGSVTNCIAKGNSGSGISAGSGSRVSGCTADSNDLDGITLSSDCVVLNNTCDSNGLSTTETGAGIRATASDNRIEGNNCTDADFGIVCSSAGNIIVRNTCAGNTTNWSLVANNVYGPIIDRTAPGSAAVSGNAAADATGSTHANANFSY